MPNPKRPNPLRLAIFAAGGVQAVADRFGITHQAVCFWVSRRRMPADKVADLCEAGANVVPPELLRQWLAEAAADRARAKVLAKVAA